MRHLLVVLVLLSWACHSFSQTKTPQFAINPDGAYVDPDGIFRTSYVSKIPINMRYNELAAEHRALVRSQYQSMPEADEPPFPKDGLESIFRTVAKAQAILKSSGSVTLVADIGSDGKVTSVAVLRTPNPGMARFVSEVLLLTEFKPAVCSGQPCKMQYPFYMGFSVSR